MAELHFTDAIDVSYHDALEALFFFNPLQSRYSGRIMQAVEEFGPPEIFRIKGKITLGIKGRPECRCLLAFYGPKLVGVMMYFPEPIPRMNILHLAVEEDCILTGEYGIMNLVYEMLRVVKAQNQPDPMNEYFIYYVNRSIKFLNSSN